MKKNCVFCQIIQGNIFCEKILENNDLLAFRDINPVALKHVLIVPKMHVSSVAELGDDKEYLGSKMILFANQVAKKENIKEAYRIVINNGKRAGQSVFHLHLHLLGGRKMYWPPG